MDLLTANDAPGQHAPSYYAATANATPDAPALDGDVSADVCIIGGGFTGLSAALHLAEKGLSVRLLEANRVGWGASGRNGGQICTGQRREQDYLEKTVGLDQARALWSLAEEAKATLRALIAKHDIRCDLKAGSVHGDLIARYVPETHAYVDHLAKTYNYTLMEPLDRQGIRDHVGTQAYHGGLLDRGAGHLHPLNYALGLAVAAQSAGVVLHERSRVSHVSQTAPHKVQTANGSVTAGHVIYACNGYMGDLQGNVSANVMPINNFIAATKPLDEDLARELIAEDVCVADSKFVVNYYRLSADRRMLFGGGETYGYRFPSDIAALVRPNMEAIYPQLAGVQIDYAWGGTLGITRSRMPYFKALAPTILTAGGYSGQGVAMTTIAGKVLAEYVAGQTGRFETFANINHKQFPGGGKLRHPLLVLAMSWYALRDKLGI